MVDFLVYNILLMDQILVSEMIFEMANENEDSTVILKTWRGATQALVTNLCLIYSHLWAYRQALKHVMRL